MKKLFITIPFLLTSCAGLDIDQSLYNKDVEYLYGMKTERVRELKQGFPKQKTVETLKSQGWIIQEEKQLAPTKSGELESLIFASRGNLLSSNCSAIILEMAKDTGLKAINPFMCSAIGKLSNKK